MSQDRLVGIWTIAGHIGVGQAIEQVAVSRFDSVEPCLSRELDRQITAIIVFSNVLDPEIIHCKIEPNWVGVMFP